MDVKNKELLTEIKLNKYIELSEESDECSDDIVEKLNSTKMTIAIKNIEDFYTVLTYLKLVGIIKGWSLEFKEGNNYFLIDDIDFENNELRHLKNISNIGTLGYLGISTTQLYKKAKLTYWNCVRDKYDVICAYESRFAKKKNIKNNLMKRVNKSYLSDIIIKYDGSDISDDHILPCTINTIYKNKWYKLNNLGNIMDYITLWLWYKYKSQKILNNIPDDYYLIDIDVELNNDWMFLESL